MKISFKYNQAMEWDNFRRGLYSINHAQMTKIAIAMQKQGIDLENKSQVLEFFKNKISNENIDIEKHRKKMILNWVKINEETIKRMDKLFKGSLEKDITAYLTLNRRCAYNIDKNYFYTDIYSENSNSTVLHELLHFYTYKFVLPMFKKHHLDYEAFNDYKEALTIILNTDFNDLLDGFQDEGYDKQKDLRIYLEKNWPKFSNAIDFSEFVIKNYFQA